MSLTNLALQSMREEAENYRNNSPTTRRIQIKADNTTMTKDAWRDCYLLHSKSSVLMYPLFTVSSRFWRFCQEPVVPETVARTVACFVTPLDYDWDARLFSSSMSELILALILQYMCVRFALRIYSTFILVSDFKRLQIPACSCHIYVGNHGPA